MIEELVRFCQVAVTVVRVLLALVVLAVVGVVFLLTQSIRGRLK